jgi:hypothetical protein
MVALDTLGVHGRGWAAPLDAIGKAEASFVGGFSLPTLQLQQRLRRDHRCRFIGAKF